MQRAISSRTTIILFVVSFFLHLAVVLAIRHYQHPVTWENGSIAQYLYEGKGYRINFLGLVGEQTSGQAPGYPVMLWAFWSMFGQTPTAYLLLSAVACAAVASMVWPMGLLSARWFPDTPPWVAQVLVVIAPLYLWYCTRIHHTALVMAMHPWLLWAWLEWCRRGLWQGLGTGIFSGIAGLFQPVLLGVYAIVGAVLLANAMLKKDWRAGRCLILGAIAVVGCLTPWTIRNYKVHHRFILVKSCMAEEFWKGNNPHATGTAMVEGGTDDILVVYPPKAYAMLGKLSEIDMMDAEKVEAWAYIKANPGKTIELTLKKILWYWTVAPRNIVRNFQGGEALQFRAVYISYWVIVVILFLAGVITSPRPVKEYLWVVALFAIFYSGIYGMTHVGQARYRGEIEFVFLWGTAAGAWYLLNLFRRKPAAAS